MSLRVARPVSRYGPRSFTIVVLTVLAALIPETRIRATPPVVTWTPGEYYFRVDGASSLVTGTNPFGFASQDYAALFQQAALNGEKVVRIHTAKWFNFISTNADPYDDNWIADWDAVFAEAAANGLDVLPVLDVWSNWNSTMPGWQSNFFNVNATSFACTTHLSDCGPATVPGDLLVSGSATQNKWLDVISYIVAAWSGRANIIGWEIFSELDNIEGWNETDGNTLVTNAAARIAIADPFGRPLTASYRGVNTYPAHLVETNPAIDWVQLHPYAKFPPYNGNLDALILDYVRLRRPLFGKPIYIGESGLDTLFPSDKVNTLSLKPRAWVGINQAIWAAAVSGAMNARNLWFEDGYDATYDICTHSELGPVYAADPACADGDPATILTLHQIRANASAPVLGFLNGVDFTGFDTVPLTNPSGDLFGAALGNGTMTIGWVRDTLSVAPLITDPMAPGYNLADHWPWRQLSGQTVTLDMPAGAVSADWLVEFYDTTTGARLQTIDADQDAVTGDITFTLPDFQGSLAFKVYPVFPLIVDVNVTPGRANDNIQHNTRPLNVAIMSSITGAGYPIDFDATTVDPSSVRFGPGQATPTANLQLDVDADGHLDLGLQFQKRQTALPCGRSNAVLTGQTMTGRSIFGIESVRVVGCPP